MDRCWEDQYLVDFPVVTGCGRVFKVPCSLKLMRELLTDETGDKMELFFRSFFANIAMANPDKALLSMESFSTGFFNSLLQIPFPSASGRWFIVHVLKKYIQKDMQSKVKWMEFIVFTFKSIEKALSSEKAGPKQPLLHDEMANPAFVGTAIKRDHSYSKNFTEDPDDTSYLYEDN